MQYEITKKLAGLGMSIALVGTAFPALAKFTSPTPKPTPTFNAKTTPSPTTKPTPTAVPQMKVSCRKTAQHTYDQALHDANKAYKDARHAALETLKSAQKAAKTRAERSAAQQAYQQALKTARMKRDADQKQALMTFRHDGLECKKTS